MTGSMYLGLLMAAVACVLWGLFRPRTDKSRFLCLLLLGMGAMSVCMQEGGAFLVLTQGALGLVMTGVTFLVLVQEVRDRHAARAAHRRRQLHRTAAVYSEQAEQPQQERRAA